VWLVDDGNAAAGAALANDAADVWDVRPDRGRRTLVRGPRTIGGERRTARGEGEGRERGGDEAAHESLLT
jgi:hypothetical protein